MDKLSYLRNVAPHLAKQPTYPAGKPIDETAREYGLDRVVKLASNENPYSCSPKARAALEKAAAEVQLYPDAAAWNLKQAIVKEKPSGVKGDFILSAFLTSSMGISYKLKLRD